MKTRLLGSLSAWLLAAGGAWAPAAHAEYMVVLEEIGGSVVATGSGSLNLSALTRAFFVPAWPNMLDPANPTVSAGPTYASANFYSGITGFPATLGTGGATYASSGNGPLVGVAQSGSTYLIVPVGYVSGAVLGTSQTTFADTSFAALGLAPGRYVWSWGAAETADTLIVQVGPASSGASLAGLRAKVATIGKVGTSLVDKLALAETYFAVPDVAAGCSILSAFVAQVHALSGKKFTDAKAIELVGDATQVMAASGCE